MNANFLTYQQLLNVIQNMSDEEKQQTATVQLDDEYLPVTCFITVNEEENDAPFDCNHFVLSVNLSE